MVCYRIKYMYTLTTKSLSLPETDNTVSLMNWLTKIVRLYGVFTKYGIWSI